MFRVIWVQRALNDVAAAWTKGDAELRAAITQAMHRIDQLLQNDPEGQGESRLPGQRVMFQLPLGLNYEIRKQDGIVRVLHAWIIRKYT